MDVGGYTTLEPSGAGCMTDFPQFSGKTGPKAGGMVDSPIARLAPATPAQQRPKHTAYDLPAQTASHGACSAFGHRLDE